MSYITVGFSHHAHSLISRLMAILPWQRYTHVILFSPRMDAAIEASGYGNPSGVRYVDLERFNAEGGVIKRIPYPDPTAVWEAAKSQLGAKYDWGFVWGWMLRKNLQRDDRFVCHELILWAAERAGKPIFRPEDAWKTTPQHLYLISENF